MVAYKHGRHVRLVSRRGVDHTERFVDIVAAVRRLPARTLILDGEVCVFDEALVSHMHLLSFVGEQRDTNISALAGLTARPPLNRSSAVPYDEHKSSTAADNRLT
jgi:ATP dependent DNA ligase domain